MYISFRRPHCIKIQFQIHVNGINRMRSALSAHVLPFFPLPYIPSGHRLPLQGIKFEASGMKQKTEKENESENEKQNQCNGYNPKQKKTRRLCGSPS